MYPSEAVQNHPAHCPIYISLVLPDGIQLERLSDQTPVDFGQIVLNSDLPPSDTEPDDDEYDGPNIGPSYRRIHHQLDEQDIDLEDFRFELDAVVLDPIDKEAPGPFYLTVGSAKPAFTHRFMCLIDMYLQGETEEERLAWQEEINSAESARILNEQK
jgi:hypothetical protein